MQPNAGGQDLAFIEKDGKVRAVAGVVAGIEGQYLLFEFEGAKRRIKLERLVGLKLAQRETAPETALYQTCLLVDGDVLSGRIDAIAHDDLLLKPLAARGAAAPAVAIPLAHSPQSKSRTAGSFGWTIFIRRPSHRCPISIGSCPIA